MIECNTNGYNIFYLDWHKIKNKPANLEPITAYIIDFIYLFFSKVGICDISNANLNFEDEDLSNFMKSSDLKNALLILSKEILALEINRGLAKVQPKINYSETSQKLLQEAEVLRLYSNGGELFGRAWNNSKTN